MKKLLFVPLAVALLSVCACGNKTEANAGADSDTVVAVDSDSIRQADSLKAAAEQAKADSLKAAEEAKKAEEAKAAAGAKKAEAAIADYRSLLQGIRENKDGIPGASTRVLRIGERAEELCAACKAQEKYMTPEQKAEFKQIDRQIEHEFATWY